MRGKLAEVVTIQKTLMLLDTRLVVDGWYEMFLYSGSRISSLSDNRESKKTPTSHLFYR